MSQRNHYICSGEATSCNKITTTYSFIYILCLLTTIFYFTLRITLFWHKVLIIVILVKYQLYSDCRYSNDTLFFLLLNEFFVRLKIKIDETIAIILIIVRFKYIELYFVPKNDKGNNFDFFYSRICLCCIHRLLQIGNLRIFIPPELEMVKLEW